MLRPSLHHQFRKAETAGRTENRHWYTIWYPFWYTDRIPKRIPTSIPAAKRKEI